MQLKTHQPVVCAPTCRPVEALYVSADYHVFTAGWCNGNGGIRSRCNQPLSICLLIALHDSGLWKRKTKMATLTSKGNQSVGVSGLVLLLRFLDESVTLVWRGNLKVGYFWSISSLWKPHDGTTSSTVGRVVRADVAMATELGIDLMNVSMKRAQAGNIRRRMIQTSLYFFFSFWSSTCRDNFQVNVHTCVTGTLGWMFFPRLKKESPDLIRKVIFYFIFSY